ncbi:hypothetical protein RDMS_10530 [Deinococcus sp. RL]|uniref:hypothetical protein n=1 Tax=Deinococcus sp. RL TaxID=1489678 RepID=UPI0004D58692|nr:hypothetical protein [Deinococcus sp. RL]KEF33794.1 hypothetical protein RDMS_10530 [Deinococcus sp. RL]
MSRWRFPDLSQLDVSVATWRARAVRYLAIYIALALLLVGARAMTQDVRPALRAAQEREAQLTTLRDELELRVQSLTGSARVRDWAFANGMRRFAGSPTTTGRFGSENLPPPLSPQTTLEVKTEWK